MNIVCVSCNIFLAHFNAYKSVPLNVYSNITLVKLPNNYI